MHVLVKQLAQKAFVRDLMVFGSFGGARKCQGLGSFSVQNSVKNALVKFFPQF